MSTANLDGLPRIGGVLCLDFVNTVDPRISTPQVEYLDSFESLLAWARSAAAIGPEQATRLSAASLDRPRESSRVYARAVRLREAVYTLLARDSRHAASIEILNDELGDAMQNVALARTDDGFERTWVADDELDRVLWPIVLSVADLLVSDSLARVRECSGGGCGWLFLDTSKAGRRRWCSMADCGNRAKSQRRRARRV